MLGLLFLGTVAVICYIHDVASIYENEQNQKEQDELWRTQTG